MSSILKERLLANYEKALDMGRNVLIIVCRVVLKGVPVADKFIGLSNSEKKKLGFNATQINNVESGRALEDMDISIIYVIIWSFGGLCPSHLHDLLKQFKDLRNTFVHEKTLFSLDKNKLRAKLGELDVLYTEILQELKIYCDPAEIALIDHNIADTKGQLLSLKKTLDDHLQDKTEALRRESVKAISALQNIAKVSSNLDQIGNKTTQAISTLEKTTATLGKATSTLESVATDLKEAATNTTNTTVTSITVHNVNIIENLNIHGPTSQLSESEKEVQILQHLSTAQTPVNSLEIARALGLKSKNDVNSILYKLLEENLIQKVNESPPLWEIGTKGSISTQREVKLYNNSSATDEFIEDDIESKFASMSLTNSYPKKVHELTLLPSEKQVLAILLKCSEPTRLQSLVKTISMPKKDVNKTLYIMQGKGLINKVGETSPCWQILENGRTVFVRSTDQKN